MHVYALVCVCVLHVCSECTVLLPPVKKKIKVFQHYPGKKESGRLPLSHFNDDTERDNSGSPKQLGESASKNRFIPSLLPCEELCEILSLQRYSTSLSVSARHHDNVSK